MKDKMAPSFAATSLDLFNPHRSVIIDMIMIQFIAMIVTMALILVLRGDAMSSASVSYMLAGLFGSFLMLSGLYSRITR